MNVNEFSYHRASVAESEATTKPLRLSLADWAEAHAEHWGNQLSAADVEGFTGRIQGDAAG